jgi:hypothetical protein
VLQVPSSAPISLQMTYERAMRSRLACLFVTVKQLETLADLGMVSTVPSDRNAT